jgi:hypothetical protein
MKILLYDIKNYLENSNISIGENYFTNFLYNKINNNNIDDKKLKTFIETNKVKKDKEELIEISGINYHIYSLHLFNSSLNSILNLIHTSFEELSEEEQEKEIDYALSELKMNFFLSEFNLPYKIFFNENYSLELIPQYKINQFYKDNPEYLK